MSYLEALMDPARKPQYVVYNTDTTVCEKTYARRFDAQRLADKLNRHRHASGITYAVAERLEYEFEVVHWRQVTNLMSGKPVWQRSNLSYYLSVASESYWSA